VGHVRDGTVRDTAVSNDIEDWPLPPDSGLPEVALAVAAGGCKPDGRLCFGDVPQRCVDGRWQDDVPCADPTPMCRSGQCVPRRAVFMGEGYGCLLSEDGRIRCWGGGGGGSLGLGDSNNRGDEPGEMGSALPPVDLGTGRTAVTMCTGLGTSCAVLEDGHVKCWGANDHGQLGLGDTRNRGDDPGEMGDALPVVDLGTGRSAVAVSCGPAVVCALLDDRSVKCWGENDFSSTLGLGDNGDFRTHDRGDQPGEMGDALPPIDLGSRHNAVAVNVGGSSICAILENAQIKCWGQNGFGALGDGDIQPIGDNPGEMGDALLAVALGTDRTALAVSSGVDHTCALLDNLQIKCWGWNNFGQLGLGDRINHGELPGQMGDNLAAVDLGSVGPLTAVAAGSRHTCAVLASGAFKCWGVNERGNLGLGDTADRGGYPGQMGDALPFVSLGTEQRVQAVVPDSPTGVGCTCALLQGGGVKCWGDNGYGQLGLGDTTPRGDRPGQMGDALPFLSLP
jgi:alpha-tubulin suppressor-like RCC1 family protein